MPFQRFLSQSELPPGELLEVVRGADLYALCNVDGEVRAMAGVCPHHGGPLGQGALDGGLVTCPWHAWQFDSGTGLCVFNDMVRVPVYPVRVEGGEILVDITNA